MNFLDHDTLICCPCCQDPDSYLHHDQVTVFCRDEDAPRVTKIIVQDHAAAVSKVDNPGSGNPSQRRDGLAIRFWCEHCESISERTIAQHKGQSFFDVRIIREGASGHSR